MLFKVQDDAPFLIPWGLLFDHVEGKKYSELTRPELEDNFWGLKYRVSCMFFHAGNLDKAIMWTPDPLSIQRERLVAILNEETEQFAVQNGPRWGESCSVCRTRNELEDHMINPIENAHWFFYFFCHARKKYLEIESREDGVLTPELLRFRVRTMKEARGLFFLNGCSTGFVERNGVEVTWIEATNQSGFLGYIGTEALVPTRFAWHLGRDFLRLILVDGLLPVQAMAKLRKQHWPLSLLYALFCPPNVAISMPEHLPFPSIHTGNYCDDIDMGRDSVHARLPFLGF